MNPPSGSSAGGKNARQPKSPAWKGSRASATGQRRTTAAGGATWQQERERDDRPRIARVLAVVLAVLLVGAFLYLAAIRPQATPLVVFTADPYPLRMPPLAFAQEDAALLENVAQQNLQVRKEYRVPLAHAEGALERFGQALAAAGRGSARLLSWRQQAIVIYVAAHGAVDERGPCLIPPAADPYNSREWLPLKDLLAAVKNEPSLKSKRKLLVLDCQRMLSSWRSGLLDNRFAEELPRAVEETDDPNLYVLAAAAKGQVAWPAPELRGSVFGYFLARGLRGEANPEGDSVTLAQLVGYVGPQVNGYVQARRAAPQQPALMHADGLLTLDAQGRLTSEKDNSGKQHDFPLVFVDATQRAADLTGLQLKFDPLDEARKLVPAQAAASAAAETTLQVNYTLPDLWRLYDERRSGGSGSGNRSLPAYVTDPVAWGSVQQRLAAIQERLLAGTAYQPALPNLINELGRELASDVWTSGGKLPPLNLLAKAPRQAGALTGALAAGDNFLETYLKEQDPAKKEELARRPAPCAKLVADIYALFTRPNRPLTAEGWQAAQQVLGLHLPGPEGESIEGHFLALLQKGLRPAQSSFPAALVGRALAVRQAAEAAATPADTRTHYAVERLLSGADAKRREAEDQLFLGDPRQQASVRWNAALDGDEETTGYRKAEEIRQRLSEAFRLRDEVWSELPHVAEWHFLRRRLAPAMAADQAAASARSSDQLVELMAQSVALVDQLELVAKSRDEAGTFAKRYSDCLAAYESLAATWRDVRVGLDEIAGPLVTRENRYLPGDDIREVELVTRTPLLAADFPRTIFGLYLNTLDEWAKAGPPQLRPDAESQRATDTAWRPAARKYWQEFHRLLEYEFRVEYDKHLASTTWQSDTPADSVLRAAGENAGWSRLRGLLDTYDEEMQRARSPVWDAARSALAASETLRGWDRRVRVSAAWLCCFGEELESPVQSRPGQTASHATPARWLQEFDGAHLTAWHAARAVNDFWGSGDDAPANSPPFFAMAARRCEDVLQVLGPHYTPLRYDPPGGAADMLPAVQDGALAALRAWDPLKVATSYSPPTDSSPTTMRIEIQPASAAPKQPLAMPPGVAALSVPPAASGAAGGVRFAFDPAGRLPQFAVPLPVAGSETLKAQAYASLDEAAGSADAEIAARLWYRGHVRRAPLELGRPHDFVHISHVLKEYSAPTIEVRGKDSARGSVMFIFDCSASMQNVDKRFDGAKDGFMELLREMAAEGRDGVRLGLRFYGRKPGPGQPPANPNPDRDVTEAVAIGESKASAALAEMQALQEQDCVGRATPLYFAISQALDTAFRDSVSGQRRMQQIVVISDGVNIPVDSTFDGRGGITINRRGEQVNAEDYRLLQDALRRHPDTQVTVKLFGGQISRVEREQLEALGELEKKNASFKVVVLRTPKDLYRSIRDSFPKTTVELAAAAGSAATQPLALNQETPVKEWPQDGLLLLSPDPRELRVMVAGETDSTLRAPLALVGGEKVVVQYEGQSSRPALQFLNDVRRDRDNPVAAVTSGLAEPALDLRVAPLDPHRNGGVLDMLFVRLRAEPLGQRFTPRPRYAWIEVDPLGAPSLEPTIPVIDAAWENHTELPVLQIPVRAWPPLATRAKIRAWFRYTDPPLAARLALRRGRTPPPLEPAAGATPASGRWSVEEVGGEAGQQRKISVTFDANENDLKYENLLGQAVWLSPPPDKVERRFAKDGSRAIHEFIYTRLGTSDATLELYVASRQQFERGAYFAELTVNVVD